jgi:transcription elongation factor Elf1
LTLTFKLGLSQIRETSLEDSLDDTQELIVDFLNILKEVADKHLSCPKCHETYTFRVCTGLSHKQDNAIELTCAVCGDYYSCSEKSQDVTYYNEMAWREVDDLRIRCRGFAISFRLGEPGSAVLYIYDDRDKRPVLWINGLLVFERAVVRQYWSYSKELIKKWKKGEPVTGKYIPTGDAKIYILDEVCKFY